MNQATHLTTATRVFGLAAIAGLGLLSPGYRLLLPILVLVAVAATVVYLSATSSLPLTALIAMEAVVSGLVIGSALPEGAVFLPYLAALCLVAGLLAGTPGVLIVLLSELATIILAIVAWSAPSEISRLLPSLAPWVLTGMGLGLLGTWLRSVGKLQISSVDPAYEVAYRLVSQLRTVANRLSYGLDSTLIGREICTDVIRGVAANSVAVFVRADSSAFAPIALLGEDTDTLPGPHGEAFVDCQIEHAPAIIDDANGTVVGLPLRAGSRLVGVVVARLSARPQRSTLSDLSRQLQASALRLDTALVFDQVRHVATTEERRRLAREIHDGIAQEIAGLGYALDNMSAQAETEDQRSALAAFRKELSRIVAELRLSIFDLRSEVVGGTGLGQALSDYMRRIGSQSDMTVHISLDEAPTRLRPEVEVELLRIVQEAATNARKHSGASNLWVTCKVSPPAAEIELRDDGCGIGRGRNDSYGLRIMKERADRLGAMLEVKTVSAGQQAVGTVVRVVLDPPNSPDGCRETEGATGGNAAR